MFVRLEKTFGPVFLVTLCPAILFGSDRHPAPILFDAKTKVSNLAVSQDEKFVAASVDTDADRTVRIWEISSGKMTKLPTAASFAHLSFSPRSSLLAFESMEVFNAKRLNRISSVVLANPKKGEKTAKWLVWQDMKDEVSIVRSLKFSPDGKLIAVAGCDHTGSSGLISLYDVATNKLHRQTEIHAGDVLSVCFSHDGKTVFAGTGPGQKKGSTLVSWEFGRRRVQQFNGRHKQWIQAIVQAPRHKFVITGAGHSRFWKADPEVIVWDQENRKLLKRLTEHSDCVLCLAVTPDEKLLVSGDVTGHVVVWELPRMKVVRRLSFLNTAIVWLNCTSKHIVIGTGDGKVRRLPLADLEHNE